MKKHLLMIGCLLVATASLWAQNYDFTDGQLFYKITSENAPRTVKVVSEYAGDPYYTETLTGDIVIPETVTHDEKVYTVTEIGRSAFYKAGITSVSIPETVTEIREWAFAYNTHLTSISIPDAVDTVRTYICYGSTGIRSVHIGKGVDTIMNTAFNKCPLEEITVDAANTRYKIDDSMLYTYDGTELVRCPVNKDGVLEMLPTVIRIRHSACKDCSNLTKVIIPDATLYISRWAFENCTSLGEVVMGNSVKFIGMYAFNLCSNLNKVNIPASVTSIEYSAFGSTVLNEVILPKGLESLQGAVFYGVTTLERIIVEKEEPLEFLESHAAEGFGISVSKSTPVYVLVESLAAYQAADVWKEYNLKPMDTLTVSVTSEHGTVEGTGRVRMFEYATLTATADEHYSFVKWSDDNPDNPRTIRVTEDINWTAVYAIDSHTLMININDEDMGYVELSDDWTIYEHGTEVTLTAVPNEGYRFVNWSDDEEAGATRTIIMNEDIELTVNFERIPDGPDAIVETNDNNAQVFGSNNRIIINNAANATVAVFDIVGKTIVKDQRMASNKEALAVPHKGIYLVRINNNTVKKVLVR